MAPRQLPPVSGLYAESIAQQEVQLAFIGDELVGTLRVLLQEPIVWPEVVEEDAIYVYNLAVRRSWAELGVGNWAYSHALRALAPMKPHAAKR